MLSAQVLNKVKDYQKIIGSLKLGSKIISKTKPIQENHNSIP